MPAVDPRRKQEALRIAAKRRRFWVGVTCVVLPLTAFTIWAQLRDMKRSASQANASQAVAVAKPSPLISSTSSTDSLEPSVEVARLIAALPISAVMPGQPPRIVIHGRVLRIGDMTEAGVAFAGIEGEELRFTDSRGVVYGRRL